MKKHTLQPSGTIELRQTANSYFTIVENILIDKYGPEAGIDTVYLLILLKRIAGAREKVRTTYDHLSQKTGWTPKKISRCLKTLESKGLIRKVRTQKENCYWINDIMPENIAYYKTQDGRVHLAEASPPVPSPSGGPIPGPEPAAAGGGGQGTVLRVLDLRGKEIPDFPQGSPQISLREDIKDIKDKIRNTDNTRVLSDQAAQKTLKISPETINRIPQLFRGVAIRYMELTGKDITEPDIESIGKLSAQHKPAVVMTNLERICRKLRSSGHPDRLNFGYVFAVMKNYSTLFRKEKAPDPNPLKVDMKKMYVNWPPEENHAQAM